MGATASQVNRALYGRSKGIKKEENLLRVDERWRRYAATAQELQKSITLVTKRASWVCPRVIPTIAVTEW
jgi:seryl-tRNA synthetase